jgi:hypothetical protein
LSQLVIRQLADPQRPVAGTGSGYSNSDKLTLAGAVARALALSQSRAEHRGAT